MRSAAWLALAGCLAFVGCIGLAAVNLTYLPFEPDTASYLFQAKLFANGQLFAEAPPDFGFSPSPHINIHDGKWYTRYSFLWPAMLVPGIWLGAPILVPALLTALTLVFLYLFVQELFESREVAALATFLVLVSPLTLGVGSTLFSQSGSRFLLVLFLWGLIKIFRTLDWRFAVLAGLALGMAFNVRPLTALTFAAAGALLSLLVLWRSRSRRTLVGLIPAFLIPLALMVSAALLWNFTFTGNALQTTFNVMQPNDRLGFGVRGEGYPEETDGLRPFTPEWAAQRTWRHTIPSYLHNALGLGRYRAWMTETLTPFSERSEAGIAVKSRETGERIEFLVSGSGDGSAAVRFQAPSGANLEPEVVELGAREERGRVSLTMRFSKQGGLFLGEIVRNGAAGTETISTLLYELEPPLEIGIFARGGRSGQSTAEFDHVAGSVGNELEAWSANDKAGDATQFVTVEGDRLRIRPEPGSAYNAADAGAGLVQVIPGTDFDVSTHVTLDWKKSRGDLLEDWLFVAPLALVVLAALAAFFRPAYRGAALFCLLILVCHHAGQYFYWGDHSTWGHTPVSAVYYAEAVSLGLMPVVAAGLLLVFNTLVAMRSRVVTWLAVGLVAVMSANVVETYAEFGRIYREWHPVYQRLPGIVEKSKLDNAVVFVPGGRNAPIGDYPFVDLERARVIYYRLGPWKAFGLPGKDWREVYDRYFSGRVPYTVSWYTKEQAGRQVWHPRLDRLQL